MSPNPALLTWPAAVAAGGPLTATFLGYYTTNNAVISLDYGRTILVGGAGTYGEADPAVTIGGISATRDASHALQGSAISLFRATVPTGTTATITVSDVEHGGYGVWAINAPCEPYGSALSDHANTVSVTIPTVANGFIIAMSGGDFGMSHAWTAPAGVAKRWHVTYSTGADVLTTSGADTTVTWQGYGCRLRAVSYTAI